MQFGEARHLRWTGHGPALLTGLALGAIVGCASTRPSVEEALRARSGQPAAPPASAAQYRVGCPDMLTISVGGQTAWTAGIAVDGRIDLAERGRLRIEGLTPAEVAGAVAETIGVPATQVSVEVGDYRSQKVYIFGQVNGQERAVPFRGQETVLELLQRAGGITAGAELSQVYVIRAHVAEGKRPEYFPVNLHDIVVKNDQATNLVLQPSDQVCIGETRRSRYEKCVPPLFRPFYESMLGLYRSSANAFRHLPGDDTASAKAVLPAAAGK